MHENANQGRVVDITFHSHAAEDCRVTNDIIKSLGLELKDMADRAGSLEKPNLEHDMGKTADSYCETDKDGLQDCEIVDKGRVFDVT